MKVGPLMPDVLDGVKILAKLKGKQCSAGLDVFILYRLWEEDVNGLKCK